MFTMMMMKSSSVSLIVEQGVRRLLSPEMSFNHTV